jgi:hypothetical protein
MRPRVRFSVLPWEFSLAGEDLHSNRDLGSLYNLGLRPLLALHARIYHHSHHQGNVTAPYGRPYLRSRLHFGHNQKGGPRNLYGHVVALGKKCVYFVYPTVEGLLVGGSRDRIPVVSLGIFFRGSSDGTMCPGVDSASKNEYQDFSWG